MEKTGSILRSIFDSTDDVWFFIAPDYSISFFNQKAFDNGKLLHGRELKAGDSILDYARDTTNNIDVGFIENFEKALDGEHIREEKKIEYAETAIWCLSKYIPVYHEGKLTGVSVSVSDISKEKILELEHEKNREEISMLLRRREEFMSIASHELKTPITGIKGFLQLLTRKAHADKLEYYEQLLSKATLQVDRITGLINDLLDVSRIDSGKLKLKYDTFSLPTLINDCLQLLQPLILDHKITVLDGEEIMLHADKNRLEQVICNLISNAVKYSEEGSEVIIKTAKTPEDIMISIKDHGVGITREQLSLLFNRFYRVDESNKSKAGLGLGLYISKDIVERHKGRIEVNSEPGKGSEFIIHLSNEITA